MGYVSVIKDHSGSVIRTYLGPACIADANKAEVLSLICGCKELKTLNGLKAIVEGDSFLTIQWAFT